MSQISTLVNCPAIQSLLVNEFGDNPQLYVEPLVLSEFYASEFNRMGTSQTSIQEKASPGGGKSREVELVYSPRLLESSVKTNEGKTDCVAGDPPGDTTKTYDVGDYYKHTDLQINLLDLRHTCEENTAFVARKLAQKVVVMDMAIETDLFQRTNLLKGNFAAGESLVVDKVKTVSTRGTDDRFSTDAMKQVSAATKWAGYPTAPIVVGGRSWYEYWQEVNAGCCAIDGIDVSALAAQNRVVALTSYRADDEFGEGAAISVAPGAVQLLEWMEYQGMAFRDLGVLQQLTIVSPRTGLQYDLKVNIDCNGIMNFFLTKYYNLVAMPEDIYYPGDRLYGVNRVNKFQITNPTS